MLNNSTESDPRAGRGGFGVPLQGVHVVAGIGTWGPYDQLPVPDADRAGLGSCVEQDRVVGRRSTLGDRGPGVAAVERQGLVQWNARERQQGRVPVDHVQRRVHDRAGLDVAFPGRERGDPHAPFVERRLVRLGAGRCWSPGRGPGRRCRWRRRTACLLADALPVDRLDDLADGLVERREHSRVGPSRLRRGAHKRLLYDSGTWCGAWTALNAT